MRPRGVRYTEAIRLGVRSEIRVGLGQTDFGDVIDMRLFSAWPDAAPDDKHETSHGFHLSSADIPKFIAVLQKVAGSR